MSSIINIKDYKINLNNRAKIIKSKQESGIFDFLLKNEMLLIIVGFFALVMIAVIVAGMYQKQPGDDRDYVAFNQFNLIILSLCFVYIIFTFMNDKIDLFGKTFDMGMILYIAIVMFIMFILGG